MFKGYVYIPNYRMSKDHKSKNLYNAKLIGEKTLYTCYSRGFPGGASGKEPTCQCRRCKWWSSIPGLGRSPGGGSGNPLQYSCLENPHEQRSLVGYSLQGHKELDMMEATWHAHFIAKFKNIKFIGNGWFLLFCVFHWFPTLNLWLENNVKIFGKVRNHFLQKSFPIHLPLRTDCVPIFAFHSILFTSQKLFLPCCIYLHLLACWCMLVYVVVCCMLLLSCPTLWEPWL